MQGKEKALKKKKNDVGRFGSKRRGKRPNQRKGKILDTSPVAQNNPRLIPSFIVQVAQNSECSTCVGSWGEEKVRKGEFYAAEKKKWASGSREGSF